MTAVTTTEALALLRRAKRTALEDRLLADIAKLGLPVPEREYRFSAACLLSPEYGIITRQSAPAMLDTSGGVTTDTGGPMYPEYTTTPSA